MHCNTGNRIKNFSPLFLSCELSSVIIIYIISSCINIILQSARFTGAFSASLKYFLREACTGNRIKNVSPLFLSCELSSVIIIYIISFCISIILQSAGFTGAFSASQKYFLPESKLTDNTNLLFVTDHSQLTGKDQSA